MKYIGAHFSISNGFDDLVSEAVNYNANAFALFTKPATQWNGRLITEEVSDTFKSIIKVKDFDTKYILPHASYLINMGNPDKEKRKKAKDAFIKEMERCKQLGLSMLNFHPGSSLKQITDEECIKNIGECIQEAIESVPDVMPIFETMAGQGSNIGHSFEHIRDLIDASKYTDKVGVCIDTCHTFAAGYNLKDKFHVDHTFELFDKIVGLKYLKGMHLNDSKFDVFSNKDRHESIGKGFIGYEGFKAIIQNKSTDGIPLILETPDYKLWSSEIKLLRSYED